MTTTASAAAVPASAVSRRASLATAGALLWTLSSAVWAIAELEDQAFGSLRFVSVAVAWWAFLVLPPVLLVAGHLALRAALRPAPGRLGTAGIVGAATGLAAMGLGIGIEVASMSAGGGEVALGHAVLLIGFLVSIAGGLVTGVTVLRRRRNARARTAGWLLVLALPLGLAIGALGSAVAPENDAVFWAALTVPTGIAWMLLGSALRSGERPAPADLAPLP